MFYTSKAHLNVIFGLISAVTDDTQRKFQVPVSTWTIPVCDEDWDQGQLLSCLYYTVLPLLIS